MLKLNPVVRPGLFRTTRAPTISNRQRSSTVDSPTDGYMLPSGDTIPSIGLGTWRMSREDAGEATKVGPEKSFDRRNPNGQLQAALSAGYRHIDCAWEYGVHNIRINRNPEDHLMNVHRTRRPSETRSTRAACEDKTSG